MRAFSAVVLGAGGVGKSALTVRFTRNTFADSYDPTIEETYRKPMKVDDELCLLEGASGFILVFSLTQEMSMREIEFLRQQIHRIKGVAPLTAGSSSGGPSTSSLPIVIVGAKSDLISEREVSRELMTKLSQQWGCPFYETSAKNNWNVNEVFEEIVRQMRAKIPEEEKIRMKKRKPSKCAVM